MELEGFLKRNFLYQEECREADPHRAEQFETARNRSGMRCSVLHRAPTSALFLEVIKEMPSYSSKRLVKADGNN